MWIVAAIAVAAAGCRSRDPGEQAEAAGQPGSGGGYLDRGLSAGKQVLSSGKQHGERALATGRELAVEGAQLGTRAYRQTRRWSEASLDEVRAEAVAIVAEGGGDMAAAAGQVNQLLERLARDAGTASTADRVARMIVLMVPIVGPTTRYLDARRLYQVGRATHDPAKIDQARRETLIAFVEAGLDIGMLGLAGSKIDLVATGADKVLSLLRAARAVSTLAGTDLRTFERLLDTMLEHDDIRAAVDAALTVDLAEITPAR